MTHVLREPNIPTHLVTGTDPFSLLVRGLHGDLALLADSLQSRLERASCQIVDRVVAWRDNTHPFVWPVWIEVDVGIRDDDGTDLHVEYFVGHPYVEVLVRGETLGRIRTVDIHHKLDRILPRRVRRLEARKLLKEAEERLAAVEEAAAFVEESLMVEVEDDDDMASLEAKVVALQAIEIEQLLEERQVQVVDADVAVDVLRTALVSAGRHETVVVFGRAAS